MKDIQLDFLNKKIIDNYIDNKERVLQQIKVAVRSWLGDFFINEDFGVDYDNSWSDMQLMESEIKKTILNIPDVFSINSFNIKRIKVNENSKTIDEFQIKCSITYNKEILTLEDIIKLQVV